MATWITHLRIAENLLMLIPDLDAENFAVGNIAPDSGIPDEKWEKFTPPSSVTHFNAPPEAPYRQADLKFYRQHLAGFFKHNNKPSTIADTQHYSFLLGYFCHLVCDNLWRMLIGLQTYQRFKEQFDADRNFIWEVKKDWYGLDFEYVRDHPNSLYWQVFLNCSYPINYLDILLVEGVRQRIEYIKTYYRRIDDHALERINHPRIYLTMPEVDRFVEQASERLHNIYYHLQTPADIPETYWSTLELSLQ